LIVVPPPRLLVCPCSSVAGVLSPSSGTPPAVLACCASVCNVAFADASAFVRFSSGSSSTSCTRRTPS
jgi:hypothetical protein